MKLFNIFILFIITLGVSAGQHPGLTLTQAGVQSIRAGLSANPMFQKELEKTQHNVDLAISEGFDIPIPKDMAGGYTHERHKVNYNLMHKAGNLYQITGEEKYAKLVKDMLMEYAEIFPTLPIHPTKKSYATGKIFWQCLNDANWVVFTSQAYDCIYNYLSAEERKHLEEDLFVPYADFLSIENPKFFNRIHNHSTWANAAVGMMALAMDNDTLLQKALYGLQNDGINADEFDDDGGFFKMEGVTKAGFLAQLDYSFSPDGYFSEGPYYQRYAIFPFLVFSHALHNKKPELDIFNYRDGILKKATQSLLQLTNTQGHFFPINDAQKGMSFNAFEIVNAVNIMYMADDSQDYLLDWAYVQDAVILNEAGFKTAKALDNHKVEQLKKTSKIYRDGVDGKGGGVAAIREGDLEVLFKFSTQGMGHGHFDRLSYSLYDGAGEVVQDYGAVRWVNVDQKAGGRYLPENKTFGKQTIGHNTAVINGISHYKGSVKKAEAHHPLIYYHNFEEGFQVVSAIEDNAYKGTSMHRSIYLINDEDLSSAVMLDLLQIKTEKPATIELPLWFVGQTMKSSFDCPKLSNELSLLGEKNGYQHIWKESSCNSNEDFIQFNWFNNNRFYTMSTVGEDGDEMIKGRLGANDPNYNLRPDPVLIHKRNNRSHSTFVNVIEPHGRYDRSTEIPDKPYALITDVQKIYEDDHYLISSLSTSTHTWTVMLSTSNNDEKKNHKINFEGKEYVWEGVTKIKKETK